MNEYAIIILAVTISTFIGYAIKQSKEVVLPDNDVDLRVLTDAINSLEKRFLAYENNFFKANEFWHASYSEQRKLLLQTIKIVQEKDNENKKSIRKLNKIVYQEPTEEDKDKDIGVIVEKLDKKVKTIQV